MKILILESTPATPHAETALEIGIKESIAGSKVTYSPIFHLLPRLLWRSNINGNNSSGKRDSLVEWLNYLVNIISKYSQIDIPNNFDIMNIKNLKEIQKDPLDFIYDDQPFGKLVFANAVEITRETSLEVIKNNRDLCMELALTAIITYEISKNLITKHKPDKVVFFNGRTIETYPIYIATLKLGVNILIHERGPTKNHFTLWSSPPQYIDSYANQIRSFSLGRNQDGRILSAAIFYERQRNANLSTFQYINNKQNHNIEISFPNLHENFIVFFSSSNWEIELIPDQDLSNGLGTQYEAVEKLSDICKLNNIQLVIRLHPNSSKSEVDLFTLISKKNYDLIILPNDTISSYNLGIKALRIFTYSSTISWEFMYKNIGCAILAKSIGSNFDGVIELNNIESITDYITNDLKPINKYFPIILADFLHNYGERYDYYNAETLFSGTFNLNLARAV